MTYQEKAQELIEKYKDYVHGYVGSSMLTNTEYPDQIERQAKQCAIIAVDEIIEATKKRQLHWRANTLEFDIVYSEYWQQVKNELTK